MKRTLSSSVLKKKVADPADGVSAEGSFDAVEPSKDVTSQEVAGVKPRLGGSGSAWKAGALSDAEQILQAERSRVVDRILSGRQELRIDPLQIIDVIGTDRRDDWRDQGAFEALRESIAKNGQDTPIHVWPADPDWRPDERDPENVDGVTFQLIVGRRRHAILEQLNQPVRALLLPQAQRGTREEQFEMLFMRFRENEERENLSAFERLVSIGEMFEQLQRSMPNEKLSATEFAKRVGVHNSAVSRGRAIFAAKDKILHACKNVYELSHRDLEKVLQDLTEKAPRQSNTKKVKLKKLVVQRRVGAKKLSLTGQGGRLSVAAAGLSLDKDVLNGLGDVIVEYLEEHGTK